jgi:hypothetical protein
MAGFPPIFPERDTDMMDERQNTRGFFIALLDRIYDTSIFWIIQHYSSIHPG